MSILNLTQHNASPAQVAEGVREPSDKGRVQALLTFTDLPTREEIEKRAYALSLIALEEGYPRAMVGGFGALMGPLERALNDLGITPIFAFSERVSEEVTLPDGTVRKVSRFRHLGWV